MIPLLMVFAAIPGSPPVPGFDAFGESPAHPPPAAYSPDAQARIEAGWISNLEPRLGVPTFFWAPRPAQRQTTPRELGLTAEQAARRWLFLYGELYRQSPASLAAQPLDEVHDLGDGAVIVRFRKVSHGVRVFRDTLAVVMTQGLELVALSGYLSPHDQPRDFKLAAGTALSVALQDATGQWLPPSSVLGHQRPTAGWEDFTLLTPRAAGPARARKVLYPLAERLEAAWQLELAVVRDGGGDDAYSYVVSAEDGRLLMRQDLTAHASYRVWAEDVAPFVPFDGPQGTRPSPNPTGLLDGFQAGSVAAQLVTLDAVPPLTDPWLPMAATTLSGNNIEAYADLVAPDGYSDGGTDAGSDLNIPASAPGVFDWSYQLAQNADASVTQRYASGTSAFFVTNWAHDVLYTQGFDEKSGNGQRLNFSRGGLEGDPVLVEVQDHAARNAASMRTPADGRPGKLTALLFDGTGPSLVGLSWDGGVLDAGMLGAGPAFFGPQAFDLTAPVVRGYDGVDSGYDGCDGPLLNAAEVTGNIVLFDTPRCAYAVSAVTALDAGALGVLLTHTNQGLIEVLGPPDLLSPPVLLLQRDAGLQLAQRLDGGAVTLARMYRPPVYEKDSALDHTILAHEYAHFLSGRLVGDGNGLLTQQARSLGEGWSDFFALWMMVRETDAQVPTNPNWSGVWAIGSHAAAGLQFSGAGNPAWYLGVRRYPYSANFAKNGLSYRHLQLGQALPAVPGAPTNDNTEIHNAGEVWCQMLWEGFVAMLNASRLTFPVARERMLGYLVASLKVTPPLPTFLEARDALLSVVAAKDPQDLALWLAAFARRGIGLKATGPDRFSSDNKPIVEDLMTTGNFIRVSAVKLDDAPGYCDKDGVLDVGEQGTLKVTVLNVGAGALSSTQALVTTTAAGVTFGNGSTLSFSPMGPFSSSTATIPVSLGAATAPVQLPLEVVVADPGLSGPSFRTTVTLLANADQVPATVERCEGNVQGWSAEIDGTTGYGYDQLFLARGAPGQREFSAPNVPFAADSYLTTPRLEAGAGPVTMTFKHRWSFEVALMRNYDGARLEVSTDEGATWAPVPPTALTPGYNGALFATSGATLRGEQAFVATSPGYPAMVSQSVAFGTQYAGKKFLVRLRISTDTSGGAPGWAVDDLGFTGLTNQPFLELVTDRARCVNRPPTVSLGPDRAVDERTLVDLMPAVADADGDVPTRTWVQLAGPAVTLSGATFTAPEVPADTPLAFRLTVSDGKESAMDEVTLTVKDVNRVPFARAGEDQQVTSGQVVTLSGSAADTDNDPLTYAWTQPGGPAVTLSGATTAQPTFTAPAVEVDSSFVFSLVVSDGKASSPPSKVEVVVVPERRGCGCSGAPEALGWLAGALTLAAWKRRRRTWSGRSRR